MDSSTSVKSKGGTSNRPLTSRPSLSRNTKTGSPTPSPKAAAESPRPAASRGGVATSKPPATKGASAVKEANAAKSHTVRTVAPSLNKPKTVTHRDPASPIKPAAKQTTRPQNGEKGTRQTASPLITKNEAAKKTAEGAQLNKPKPGLEGENTTPSKRNGTVKREVAKPPEHGSVPKDKTLCLRPESSASVPSKPTATASSPTKTLKANSISHKPKQIVPPPEKPVNTTSSTKATKSPITSTRPGATTSTATKPVKAASPLVKAPKPTSIPTKVTKIPTSPVKPLNTSPVKPLNTSSAPTKPRNAMPAKPPGNTMSTTNQIKVGKRLPIANKAPLASAKQINNVPTAIKPVKLSAVAHESLMEERSEATPVINEVTPVVNEASQILPTESPQVINLEACNVEMNKTEKAAESEKPLEPLIVAEEVVAVPVNHIMDNTTVADAKTGEELLEESELPLDTNQSIILTEQCSIETHSQDKETPLLIPLTHQAKSPTKQVMPLEADVSHSIKEEPMSECSIVSSKPSYEEEKSEKPFEEQVNVPSEHVQEELRSPLEIPFTAPGKPLEEKIEKAKELKEGATSSELPVNVCEGVHVPNKTYDEAAFFTEPSKEAVECLIGENRSLEEEQMAYMDGGTYLNQVDRMPIKPLDEEISTAECVEPLEDVVTSSLEQVTPLEEIGLSEDELEPVGRKGMLLEEQRNSSKTLDQLELSPVDPRNPLELLTSSTEELTPSEEDVELLKDDKQTLEQRISSSEHLACKMDLHKPTEMAIFSMEPVLCSNEEINIPEEPLGGTVTNEESKTSSEKERTLNEILQSSCGVVKYSEEGNIPLWDPLQSSVHEARLSEEQPVWSVETPFSSEVVKPSLESLVETDKSLQENQALFMEPPQIFSEVKSSQEEATLSVEPLQASDEQVKCSGEEPLWSMGLIQSSVEADQSLQDRLMLEESQQFAVVDDNSTQKEQKSSKEPLNNSDRSLGGEFKSSPLLLKSSLEPLTPSEANLLLTETKEGISSLEEPRSEGSHSLVQLPDQCLHLATEKDNEVSQELLETESNASVKEDEILLMGQQRPPIEQFHSITEPVQYDAEIFGVSSEELSGQVKQTKKVANRRPEGLQEKLPVGSELFEEPLNMMPELDHRPLEHVTAAEKQLDSTEAEVKDISNPMQCQSVQESVLFPEEPLTYKEESKTTSVETTDYPEKSIKSSLGQVKCADYEEKVTKPSMHELWGYPEDLTTEKSLDTEMFTRSKYINVSSAEIVEGNTIAPILPNDKEHCRKPESAIPWTSECNAFVETSIEPEVKEPSVHVFSPLDSFESIEVIKHEVLMQPKDPEDETNLLAARTQEINYSLHYQVNQPDEPKISESLTSKENQRSTAESKPVTDLERSLLDSNFYVTMDPTEQVRILSVKQDLEEEIEKNKPPTTEVVYVPEEPISFTVEESLEPLDNSTNVLEQNHHTEILDQNYSTETLKQTIAVESESTEVCFSDDSTSISHTEPSSLQHTSSPATNTLSMAQTEQNVEISKTNDLCIQPLQNVNLCDRSQETERESWVLVKMEELSDFKGEPEERPLRPASLNQDAEAQDEQKAEEDLVERASVCSTLSDPQLAAKSSSETSTPEELRTYEDSSSGVESHSDDAATSPQTTLTPDPDLGIHMGQEEGTETPAGTPASNNKGVPPSLQIVDIEGQSQSTSPSGIFDPSENNQIVRKKELTASTEPTEHDCDERAKEKGAQRGNDD